MSFRQEKIHKLLRAIEKKRKEWRLSKEDSEKYRWMMEQLRAQNKAKGSKSRQKSELPPDKQ
jgi:hypothetical protein